MKNRIFFFFTCMVLGGFTATAQVKFSNDIEGKPYMEKSDTEIEGNPYLIPDWVIGSVVLGNGKTGTLKLRYNIAKDELSFENPKDTSSLNFIDVVKSFTLNPFKIDESNLLPLVFDSGFPAIDNQTTATYYQVIGGGKVKLLKHYKKKIEISKAFNSATSTQTFVLADSYYLLINGQMSKIKPTQKTIAAAFKDKEPQLQTYLKTNSIDYKSDADLAKLFGYYNSL
ncbi:hypothetical protein [Mucilaginibacter pineti]|nr:hypothetical protein [Mucilaginibacter pineti]